jgi:hypothetical protein
MRAACGWRRPERPSRDPREVPEARRVRDDVEDELLPFSDEQDLPGLAHPKQDVADLVHGLERRIHQRNVESQAHGVHRH